jgi:hypothetical protein
MMTDEQKSKVAELKAAIVASGPRACGAPPEVRVAVLALKAEVRRSGMTARALAAALGVHETTLCRWERAPEASPRLKAPTKSERGVLKAPTKSVRGGGFRVVELTRPDKTPEKSAAVSMTHGLRVAHAPSGIVVDGLDIETLAALLRRMA